MAKFDEEYPKVVWAYLSPANIRIAEMFGSSVAFQLGLDTFHQWDMKIKKLGLSPKQHDFMPNTNGVKPEVAMKEVLPLVKTEDEAVYLARVLIHCPMQSDQEVIHALWLEVVSRLGLNPAAKGYDPILYLGMEAQAVAA